MSVFYYQIVRGEPAFITLSRGRELSAKALSGKDVSWRFRVHFWESKERKEAFRLEKQYLVAEYERDQEEFRRNWVEFDLGGEEARENLYRLLDAFACLHKPKDSFFFRDIRPYRPNIFGEDTRLENVDDRWPLGKVYRIVFVGSTGWRRKFGAELEIDTDDVFRVAGTLNEFKVSGHRIVLDFKADSIAAIPAPRTRSEDLGQ